MIEEVARRNIARSMRLLVEDNVIQETRLASRTLSRGWVFTEFFRGGAHIVRALQEYYWAGVLDKGVGPREGLQIWFRDRRDDPRRPGGPPRRRSEERRLTREEMRVWSARNRAAVAAGQPPPMIVARRTRGFRGKFFVREAREHIRREAPVVIRQELERAINERLRAIGNRRIVLRI